MIGKKSTRFMTLLLVCVISISCRNRSSTVRYELITDSVIDHVGSYTSQQKNLKLEIRIVDLLVDFTLSDTMGRVLYKTDIQPDSNSIRIPGNSIVIHASDVSRWFFVVDTTATVWFYSSDIGTYILKKNRVGCYYALYDTNRYRKNVPSAIYHKKSRSVPAYYR